MSIALTALSGVMSRSVVVARPQASVESVRKLMIQHKVGRVVIVNEVSQPMGMISGKDILRHTLTTSAGTEPGETAVLHVMTKPVVVVPEETPVPFCASRMLESAISSIVVVRDHTLVGIVTKTDLCRFYAASGIAGETVRRRMTAEPISVSASLRVLDAAMLMADNNISRLPVVNGKLKGIITLSDLTIVNAALSPAALMAKGKIVSLKGKVVMPTDVGRLTVEQVMTRDPITILDTAPLSDATKLMLARGISGLPVLDATGKLVGIVTKTDIVGAVASMQQAGISPDTVRPD